MNKGLILSILVNIMLFAAIFFVKADAHEQAQNFVKEKMEKANEIVSNANKVHSYNTLLFQLANEIHSSKSKNKKDIIRQIKTFVKSNTDKAALTEAYDPQDKNLWKVGWTSYSFKVEFDGNKFKSIDISGMLDN